MKKILAMILCAALAATLFSGCSAGTQSTSSGVSDLDKIANETEAPAEAGKERLQMEMYYVPWTGIPIEGDDMYINWINEVTGADWKLTYASDFESEILTRAASDNMPDLIVFDTYVPLFKLYDEGILMDDWNKFADQLPQTMKNLGDIQREYFTVDGKLISIPTLGGEQLYTFMIRKDWLENLGLEMPTNEEELLEVARAFTYDDPDGDGKNNTYGFCSAGSGSMGEIMQLQNLWGPYKYRDPVKSGFYITDDGNVSSNIVDGNLKKCLDLIKKIVDEKLIDPDWYSMGLDERKPGTYSGKYGILCHWAPEDLLNETNQARSLDGVVEDWWEVMPLFDANGDGTGGKQPAMSPLGMIRSVSEKAANDPARMEAICKLLEATAFPNEGYFAMRAGAGINGRVVKPVGSRYYINYLENTLGYKQNTNIGLANYGKFVNSYAPEANIVWGPSALPDSVANRSLEMSATVQNMERYNNDYEFLLRLDTQLLAECQSSLEEFMINYVLGKNSDYEGFVKDWLAVGGQQLLDEAKTQLTQMGYIQ